MSSHVHRAPFDNSVDGCTAADARVSEPGAIENKNPAPEHDSVAIADVLTDLLCIGNLDTIFPLNALDRVVASFSWKPRYHDSVVQVESRAHLFHTASLFEVTNTRQVENRAHFPYSLLFGVRNDECRSSRRGKYQISRGSDVLAHRLSQTEELHL
jgi:hypothetical protein